MTLTLPRETEAAFFVYRATGVAPDWPGTGLLTQSEQVRVLLLPPIERKFG